MIIVYVFQNSKNRNVQIGFSDDIKDSQKHLEEKFSTKFKLLLQEKYKSKKDALIRVKQLKNKFK